MVVRTVGESAGVLETIAREASAESTLWQEALRPEDERESDVVFSVLADEHYALATESIYEGYLLHYGRPRIFAPHDPDVSILLGDYLYAHGLVRLAEAGTASDVTEFAHLISLCSQLRAANAPGDGVAWVATSALLGATDARLEQARTALRLERETAPLVSLARSLVEPDRIDGVLARHERRLT